MSIFRPAIVLLLLLTALTGAAYPALVTVLGRAAFPAQAEGSLVRDDAGRVVGSRLIGRAGYDPRDLWGRPSATAAKPYDAAASTGSNLGPSNPALHDAVAARVAALRASDPSNAAPIPIDLVTTSASGLDPHVSPAAAAWQAPRIARARGVTTGQVIAVFDHVREERWLGVFGEPVVNVQAANRALDQALGRGTLRPGP